MTKVEPMHSAPKKMNDFKALVEIVKALRGPDGCPWDKEQTHESLTPYAIEETYELVEAIESKKTNLVCEELGDVLLQVVLHAQIAAENDSFSIEDVIESICHKMVRRHPHVFSDVKVESADEVMNNWEKIKATEKPEKNVKKQKSFGISPTLPALQKAQKIGDKTTKAKFDWKDHQGAWKKVVEEVDELKYEIKTRNKKKQIHEIGDLLFATAQLGRHLKLDVEGSLREANRRFEKRYFKMIELCEADGHDFKKMPLAKKENYWSKAKKALK